jgi:hypothetical protein
VAEALDKLNLTTPSATARIGKNVNERYKRLTSSIGLETTRRVSVPGTSVLNSNQMTFNGIEKIIAVVDKSGKSDIVLGHVTPDEIHILTVLTGPARHWALYRSHPNSVDILMDSKPIKTNFTLYADSHQNLSTLGTGQSPDFPESFHDILVWGAMADEYRKMEKLPLMQDAEANYEKRLSDLRMWIAKSGYLDITQGKYTTRSFRWTNNSSSTFDNN